MLHILHSLVTFGLGVDLNGEPTLCVDFGMAIVTLRNIEDGCLALAACFVIVLKNVLACLVVSTATYGRRCSARHKRELQMRLQLSVFTWIFRTEVVVAFRANPMPLKISVPGTLADAAGHDHCCVGPIDELARRYRETDLGYCVR